MIVNMTVTTIVLMVCVWIFIKSLLGASDKDKSLIKMHRILLKENRQLKEQANDRTELINDQTELIQQLKMLNAECIKSLDIQESEIDDLQTEVIKSFNRKLEGNIEQESI